MLGFGHFAGVLAGARARAVQVGRIEVEAAARMIVLADQLERWPVADFYAQQALVHLRQTRQQQSSQALACSFHAPPGAPGGRAVIPLQALPALSGADKELHSSIYWRSGLLGCCIEQRLRQRSTLQPAVQLIELLPDRPAPARN